MIEKIVVQINQLVEELKEAITLDIADVKEANHENLLERNSVKLDSMEKIAQLKVELNEELSKEFHNGVDITKYKDMIDTLENNLKELYYLNGKLAAIVLPVREMYKEIIDDITASNGGSLVEVMA